MTSSLLAGRTALVTGASRGIGMAIAERLAAEGATVAVTARTVEPGTSQFDGSLDETVLAITKDGGQAVAIAADLSRPEERERLIQETEAVVGPIDILVNNAAVTFFNPIADFAPKRQQLMFEVQVYAPMDLAGGSFPAWPRPARDGFSTSLRARRATPRSRRARCRVEAAPCTGWSRRPWSALRRGWPRSCGKRMSRSTRSLRAGWCPPRARSFTIWSARMTRIR